MEVDHIYEDDGYDWYEDREDQEEFYGACCPHEWCINATEHFESECYSQDMIDTWEAYERKINSWWYRICHYLKSRFWPDKCFDCGKRFGRHDGCLPF